MGEAPNASSDRRRVVLHPRTALARRHDRARSFGGHVRGYTVDTDDVLALMRRQRRTSVRFFVAIVGPLIAFALLLDRVPALSDWRPLGLLPLPWLLLGPLGLFSVVFLAFLHERAAQRIEDEWAHDHPSAERPDDAWEREAWDRSAGGSTPGDAR
ncbi:MAG: hypothetical protein AAFP84_06420 [Actinomycetota bacterium]